MRPSRSSVSSARKSAPTFQSHLPRQWPPRPFAEEEPVSLAKELHGLSKLSEKPGVEGIRERGAVDQYPIIVGLNTAPVSTSVPLPSIPNVPGLGNFSSDESSGPTTPSPPAPRAPQVSQAPSNASAAPRPPQAPRAPQVSQAPAASAAPAVPRPSPAPGPTSRAAPVPRSQTTAPSRPPPPSASSGSNNPRGRAHAEIHQQPARDATMYPPRRSRSRSLSRATVSTQEDVPVFIAPHKSRGDRPERPRSPSRGPVYERASSRPSKSSIGRSNSARYRSSAPRFGPSQRQRENSGYLSDSATIRSRNSSSSGSTPQTKSTFGQFNGLSVAERLEEKLQLRREMRERQQEHGEAASFSDTEIRPTISRVKPLVSAGPPSVVGPIGYPPPLEPDRAPNFRTDERPPVTRSRTTSVTAVGPPPSRSASTAHKASRSGSTDDGPPVTRPRATSSASVAPPPARSSSTVRRESRSTLIDDGPPVTRPRATSSASVAPPPARTSSTVRRESRSALIDDGPSATRPRATSSAALAPQLSRSASMTRKTSKSDSSDDVPPGTRKSSRPPASVKFQDEPIQQHNSSQLVTTRQPSPPRKLPAPVGLCLTPCPRSTPVAGHQDWYTLKGLTHLDICPTCMSQIAHSRYRDYFIPSQSKPPNQAIRCAFSNAWVRLAWTQMIKKQQDSLETLYQMTRPPPGTRPCPGRTITDQTWHRVVDPDTGLYLPRFQVCGTCARKVRILMPPHRDTFQHCPEPSERVCDFVTNSPRFVQFIDLLDSAATRAELDPSRRPDLREFLSYARRKVVLRDCRRDRPTMSTWHYIPALPELSVCEDCYDEVVWPLAKNNHSIARMFSTSMRLLPGDGPSRCREATCQLYSARVRARFRDAVLKGDFPALKSVALRRFEAEQRFRDRREELLVAEKRGYDCDMEMKKAVDEWRRWE
ncbi:hypothetical protein N7533_004376 [Penicillium manginii]|uniref:uncharacterized protein n=1 Tax=Penicillium manginii TaxID=203109 RepID=UPI002547B0CD|nr:uncharacterized protein N7533_004376 [Penicillium manginii]KAJ5754833.1 hypothetical protein N7533_004376 [Penicillium manginii]